MGRRDEVKRYREIITRGEREDLEEFVKVFDIDSEGTIQMPMIDLPEFKYRNNPGKILQGDPRPGEDGRPEDGELIPKPEEGEGEGDDAGDETGSHEMMDLDPEDIEQILEEAYELEFDPGGETTSMTEEEGDMTDRADTGTYKDFKALFKGALKKEIALGFDDNYIEEAIKVDGFDADDVFDWARENNITISQGKIRQKAARLEEELDEDELNKWGSIEEMEENVDEEPAAQRIKRKNIDRFYEDDEEYLVPEIEESEEDENSAVIFNYRDVSGSVDEWDEELIRTLFAPMDEYLRAKYDNVRFIYVAHEKDAWEMEREGFYQVETGGGTKVSSALELIDAMVEGEFGEFLDEKGEEVQLKSGQIVDRIIEENHSDVWSEGYGDDWDKYYFGAGDGGNQKSDMEDMTQLVQNLPGKKHLHAEVGESSKGRMKQFREDVEEYEHVVAPEPFYEKDSIPDVWRAVFNDD